MMKFPSATLLLLFLVAVTSKKYDDDTSPGKVNLEDIEDSHVRAEKKLLLASQKSSQKTVVKPPPIRPPIFNPSFNISPIPNDSDGIELQKSQTTELRSQSVQPLIRLSTSPSSFVAQQQPTVYETSAAQHNSIGVPSLFTRFVHHSNADEDDRRVQQQQEAINGNELHQQLQQPVFTYNHDELQLQYDSSNNDRQQQQQQQQHDSYVMTSSSSPPSITPPAAVVSFSHGVMTNNAFRQQQPHASYLQYRSPGVHYLTNNDIHGSTFNSVRGGGERGEIQFVEYSHEEDNSGKHHPSSSIEYGNPDAVFRRPQKFGQSNQLTYAPKRPSAETNDYRMIPFPPSFISITTERPSVYVEPTRPSNYIEDTEKWQTNVVPLELSVRPIATLHHTDSSPILDYFDGRQAKSLLDSYIPSWLVTKMQQMRIRPLFSLYNQIAYDDFNHSRYFKRSPSKTSVKRKTLTENRDNEMMMTS